MAEAIIGARRPTDLDARYSGNTPQDIGDLKIICENVEALRNRLVQVNARLCFLYGANLEKGSSRPSPGGLIPEIKLQLEDLTDEVSAIELVIERL